MKKNILIIFVMTSTVAFAQWNTTTNPPHISYTTGNVGIGTTTPRGQFDVAAIGDIYLSNNTIAGTGQSIYLPGHIFFAPYNGSDWTYLQARRSDSSGSTHFQFRTWNAGSLTESMVITSIGRIGVGTNSPIVKLHVRDGQLMSSDLNHNNINVRVDGRAVPAINFTRWIGGNGSVQHNAFVGQFYNANAGGEYSLGIGTGYSESGDQNINTKSLTVLLNGNVGIGTTNPNQKLTVSGTIYGKEVKVDLNVPGPDYVFEPTYQLPSLTEIENYIKANKHLPEVPSAKEMETNGINLSEMNMLLLKKVEELTLHLIEVQKNSIDQQKQLIDQRREIEFLKSKVK